MRWAHSLRPFLSLTRTTVKPLTALVRVNELGFDARKALTAAQIAESSRWRAQDEELALSVARSGAIRLAKRGGELDKELASNNQQITELVKVSEAAPLLDVKGFAAITAATSLTVWSHQARVHSEAAYAFLAGVNPIPASSGNNVRHQLNRGGDRSLNRALHMVSISRMTHDEETRKYVKKWKAEGLTTKKIHGCIKR
jgi:transposase